MIDTSNITQLAPEQLRTFLAAADSGSFTQAGTLVHRTQSAISMQIKRLEDELQRPLFHREGRGVAMTPDGETLYRYAKRLLSLHDEALTALTRPKLDGIVRFGAPEDYAAQFLPQVLKRFAAVHPLVRVEVYCDTTPELRQRHANGKLDVILTTEESGLAANSKEMELAWIVAERGGPLEEHILPLALFHLGCLYRRNALSAIEEGGIEYRIVYSSPSTAGILAAVQAGIAIAPVTKNCNIPGCRRTTPQDGIPPIAPVGIGLYGTPSKSDKAIQSFHAFIANELEIDISAT